MTVRLQQEHKVLVVKPGDARNCQTGTATLMKKGVEPITQLIGVRPVDRAVSKGISFAAVLNNPWLGFIGKISFSLYLWQQLFLWPDVYRSASSGLFFQLLPYNLAFVLLAGILSYFWIEKPFLQWKEKWQL